MIARLRDPDRTEEEMAEPFTETLRASWGHMDFNAHMANTAYLDLSADVRLAYFAARGFSARDFERERIGPVVMKDEIEYRAEIRLREEMTIGIELAGLSVDGSRFRVRNVFRRADGRTAAVVTTDAGWFDLVGRRLTAPPPALFEALKNLDRTDDFEELPSSLRGAEQKR
jgi:acyl-CoA thioester hydrolase